MPPKLIAEVKYLPSETKPLVISIAAIEFNIKLSWRAHLDFPSFELM